jgi:hypothetical protein
LAGQNNSHQLNRHTMATTQNTLIGKASGSVGGVTFGSWKGKNVIRSKPQSVANPNSAGQQKSRGKLTTAVSLYRQGAGVFNAGFMQMANGKSAYNAFTSENVKNGSIAHTKPLLIDDLTKFRASKGTLAQAKVTNTTVDVPSHSVIVGIDNSNMLAGQSGEDQAALLLVDATGKIIGHEVNAGPRAGESATLNNAVGLVVGQTYHIYLFFVNPYTRQVSESQHLTAVAG